MPTHAEHPDAGSPSGGSGTMQDVFSDPHRRVVLYCLQTREEPLTIAELANELVARAGGNETPSPPDDSNPERLRSWLRHVHVFEMHRIGLVEHDPEDDTVRLADGVAVSVSAPARQPDDVHGPEADLPGDPAERDDRAPPGR